MGYCECRTEETIGPRNAEDTGSFVMFYSGVESESRALNLMANGDAVSMVLPGARERFDDCAGDDCYCRPLTFKRATLSGRGERVTLNPFTGESLSAETPILRNVSRFLTRLYSFQHPRSRERFALAFSTESPA